MFAAVQYSVVGHLSLLGRHSTHVPSAKQRPLAQLAQVELAPPSPPVESPAVELALPEWAPVPAWPPLFVPPLFAPP